AKNIGSSLEAAPIVYLSRDSTGLLSEDEWAEVCITSGFTARESRITSLGQDVPLADKEWAKDLGKLFFDNDICPEAAVSVKKAEGKKCARSWKILPSVGTDPAYPDVSPRDAQALREWDHARTQAAE